MANGTNKMIANATHLFVSNIKAITISKTATIGKM